MLCSFLVIIGCNSSWLSFIFLFGNTCCRPATLVSLGWVHAGTRWAILIPMMHSRWWHISYWYRVICSISSPFSCRRCLDRWWRLINHAQAKILIHSLSRFESLSIIWSVVLNRFWGGFTRINAIWLLLHIALLALPINGQNDLRWWLNVNYIPFIILLWVHIVIGRAFRYLVHLIVVKNEMVLVLDVGIIVIWVIFLSDISVLFDYIWLQLFFYLLCVTIRAKTLRLLIVVNDLVCWLLLNLGRTWHAKQRCRNMICFGCVESSELWLVPASAFGNTQLWCSISFLRHNFFDCCFIIFGH